MNALNFRMSSSPSMWKPTEETEASCWVSLSKSTNSFPVSRMRSREKPFMPMTSFRSTFEYFVSIIFAPLFNWRICFFTPSTSFSSTRSVLFRRMTSANATCSTASLVPFFFSLIRFTIHLQSTTVTMPSIRKALETSSSAKKVCATGAGAAIPVVSMMTPSRCLPFAIMPAIFLRVWMRSTRTVQQMHPFCIRWISSLSLNLSVTSWSSTPMHPNSFSITAYFFSLCSFRM
mmetsp:Transcript_6165/g.11636  ORF Transcript_6165/g.11636 Transcript_6165/m.11636 type:complete len:232 (-) Transcript_6165:842-1537(-)